MGAAAPTRLIGMRRVGCSSLVALALALSGCASDTPPATAQGESRTSPSARVAFSAEVRGNFLDSCVENAKATAGDSATTEQLLQTCECILGKVEQEYSESEFADFEKRLLDGTASEQENDQLVGWSTDCAEGSAG